MSLKSEFWVQAFIRRCNQQGLFAGLTRRGAPEAGAIFVIINRLDGTYRLLGPAPGPAYGEEGDRRFFEELPSASYEDVNALLTRRLKADSDLWVIEVEDRSGDAGLAVVSG